MEFLPQPEAFSVVTEMVVADDGLRVVLAPDAARSELVAEWVFDVGAADDPPGRPGLAHLAEHLAFGHMGDDPDDYDARLGALGGESHGWTDRERSGLGATVPAREGAFDALLDLEVARWRSLVIDDAGLARQLRVLAAEAGETLDGAHGSDRIVLDSLLWSSSDPWSRHPQAPVDSTWTAAEVQQAWPRLRDPAGAVLVLAGPLPPSAARSVRDRLGHGAVKAATPAPRECEPTAPQRAWRRDDVGEGAIYAAWPGPGRAHPDRVALEAVARWMGGARLVTGRDCGAFVVERRGGWWRLGEHARALRRSLQGMARWGLGEAEIAALRAGQLTDLARARADLRLRARVLGGCVLSTGGVNCLEEEARGWLDLDRDGTRRASARWLEWPAVTLLAVVPSRTVLAPPIPGMRPRP